MRRLLVLGLAGLSGAALAQGEGSVIPLREVEGADALALAERLLPPDIRGRVVEGKVRRQWLPGQVYWIGYFERNRPAGQDLCERTAHAVQLGAPNAPGDKAAPDTPLKVGKLQSWREVAVLRPGQAATAERCAETPGYISVRYDPARTLAAYRVLASAMTAAARRGSLPFKIECAGIPLACADPRKALASLPMEALAGIGVTCTDDNKLIDASTPGVRLISCRPLQPGAPYVAEVRFGMSGEDGQSWSVSFTHAERWPETILLSRSTVIYH